MYRDQSGQFTKEQVEQFVKSIMETNPMDVYPVDKVPENVKCVVFTDGEEP